MFCKSCARIELIQICLTIGIWLCDFYIVMDVFCCTASILHLVGIAIDRYWAVTNAAYVRRGNKRPILIMILLVWISSAAISLPGRFAISQGGKLSKQVAIDGICDINREYSFTIISTVVAFFLPMTFLICIYTKIYFAARSRIRKTTFRQHRGIWITSDETTTTGDKKISSESMISVTEMTITNSSRPQLNPKLAISPVKVGADQCEVPLFSLNLNRTTDDYRSPQPSPGPADLPDLECPDLSLSGTTFNFEINNQSPVTLSIKNQNGGLKNHALAPSKENPPDYDATTLENVNLKKQPLTVNILESAMTSMKNKIMSKKNAEWQRAYTAQRRERLEHTREKRAARTLAIVTGCFILCWLPFSVMALVSPFCSAAFQPPDAAASFLLWLGYANSLLNPIIYTIFAPDFRTAFRKILSGRYHSCETCYCG